MQVIFDTLAAAALLFLLAVTQASCGANFFSASTTASYQILPDGTKSISYTSNKEFDGLDVDLKEEAGQVKALRIKVAKAGTADAVVAAALQLQIMIGELMQKLLPLIEKSAMAGS